MLFSFHFTPPEVREQQENIVYLEVLLFGRSCFVRGGREKPANLCCIQQTERAAIKNKELLFLLQGFD